MRVSSFWQRAAVRFILVQTIVLVFATALLKADDSNFTGLLGDRINCYNGELSMRHVDVALPGRRDLNVVVARYYSSHVSVDTVVRNSGDVAPHWRIVDPVKYQYLGQGWYIGAPYLVHDDREATHQQRRVSDCVVLDDGSSESLIENTDPLTSSTYPKKTRSLALMTAFGINSNVPDTLLETNGSRWIFGHRAAGRKYLTKKCNRFGDTLRVVYHDSTTWIKKIISPIGIETVFRYSNGVDTIPMPVDSAPLDTTYRLCEVNYLNAAGDTLRVKYRYWPSGSMGRCLRKVIYPSGDAESFQYDSHYQYQAWADWDSLCTGSGCIQWPQQARSNMPHYLTQYTSVTGAWVVYEYTRVNRPLYVGDASDTGAYDYRAYIAVRHRYGSQEGHTYFEYQGVKRNLMRQGDQSIPNVTSKTKVIYPDSTIKEMFYFEEVQGVFIPWYMDEHLFKAGMWPGRLFQVQSIYGTDTVCTGYDYGYPYGTQPRDRLACIGRVCDSVWGYVYDSSDTLLLDSVFYLDTSSVFLPKVVFEHSGAPYYHPEWLSPIIPTSTKHYYTTVQRYDSLRPDILLTTTTASRFRQPLQSDWDSTELASYFHCPWLDECTTCDSTINYCYPSPTGSVSFITDSVEAWRYIPEFNMTLIERVRNTVKNGDSVVTYYVRYEYDSAHYYQPSRVISYCAVDPSDTLVERRVYDNSSGRLAAIIGPFDDTLFYEYDTNGFLWKTVDSSLVDSSHPAFETREYWPNGLVKSVTDINNATTRFFYDHIGRDSVVRQPLEGEFSVMKRYGLKDTVFTWSRIDSTDTMLTTVIRDKFLREAKNLLRVNDTLAVVTYTQYDLRGNVYRKSRGSFNQDEPVWTTFAYDLQHRLYRTTLPSGLHDSVKFVDQFTTDHVDPTGRKSRTVRDVFGNVTARYLGDSLGGSTFTAIDTATAAYDALGNIVTATDFKGQTRTFAYDKWGRKIRSVDPDVGTTRLWYSRSGKVRFRQHNSEMSYSYWKYDGDDRLVEEGTVTNPDTTRVNDRNYPGSSDPRIVWAAFRYDSYSTLSNAADTLGGLSYCKGRITEIVDSSGYTYNYYDARGRIGLKTAWVKGLSSPKKLRYTYFANNALKRITYPDSSFTEYSYYQSGLLKGVSGVIDTGNIQYESWGDVRSVNFRNGLRSRYSYDSVGRLEQVRNWVSSNRIFCRSYGFDPLGRLSTEGDIDTLGDSTLIGDVRNFAYDYRGRLVAAELEDPNGAATDRSITYSYDVNNNLTKRTTVGLDSVRYAPFSNSNCDNVIRYYHGAGTYDSLVVYQKDLRGRITSASKYAAYDSTHWNHRTRYKYDYRNLLTTVVFELPSYGGDDGPDSVINLYNASGEKVKQIYRYQVYHSSDTGGIGMDALSPGGETIESVDAGMETDGFGGGGGYWQNCEEVRYYVWSGGQVVLELENSTDVSQINIYGLGRQLARRDFTIAQDSLNVLVQDYLGTVRGVVRGNGGVACAMQEYYPYGGLYSISGSTRTHRWFAGKESDMTGMLDFGPRYYLKDLGRFLSPDPILSSASPYSYAEGNPIMLGDPTGLECDSMSAINERPRENLHPEDPDPGFDFIVSEVLMALQIEFVSGKTLKNFDVQETKCPDGVRPEVMRAKVNDAIQSGNPAFKYTGSAENVAQTKADLLELNRTSPTLTATLYCLLDRGGSLVINCNAKENRFVGLDSKTGVAHIDYNPNERKGGATEWDAAKREETGFDRPPMIGLAHEIGHLDQVLRRDWDNNEHTVFHPGKGGIQRYGYEIDVLDYENRVRREYNIVHYGKPYIGLPQRPDWSASE